MSSRIVITSAMLAACAVSVVTGTGHSAERMESQLSGDRLEIEGFTGRLVVSPGGRDIDLRFTGPDTSLERIRVEAKGGRVLVDARDAVSGSTTALRNTTVIIQNGGQASVSISSASVPPPSGETLTLEVVLPVGTPLAVHGLVGEAEIGDIGADLDFEAIAGLARIGSVGPARLALTGAGGIAVREVAEVLHVRIAGAGNVRVDAGNVDELAAEVTGSGELYFGGQARRARLELTGAATAHLAHVTEQPHVVTTGAAEVRVDNWR